MGEKFFSKSITALVVICLATCQQTLGQVVDNFGDGNHTADPAWSGTTSHFIIDAAGRLQLSAPLQIDGGGNSYLTLPFVIPANHNTTWEFLVNHTFSATGTSNGRIYLMSSSANLASSLNGYYLQFGEANAGDRIELFRQSGTTSTTVCRTLGPSIANPFTFRVRVTRSSVGGWEIFVDLLGDLNFASQATGTDNTFSTSAFFGINCRFNNDNFRDDFFYDDIFINTTPAPDIVAPTLDGISADNATQVTLNFSEALNASAALTPSQFILNSTTPAASATFQNGNASILLTFSQPMSNGYSQSIQYPALADVAGNALSAGSSNFLFFQPVNATLNDIVINEVYPDPTPSIGLPEFEYIELYNKSSHPFQLEGWQLTDGTTTTTLTNKILLPGAYLAVVPSAAVAAFANFGMTMGVTTFPSLNNSGDNIQLKTPDAITIDAYSYTIESYQNEDKDGGGFSIERIDPTDVCKGSDNWKGSDHPLGGTPGLQNAVFAVTPDLVGPKLLMINPKAANAITLVFDEKLGSSPLQTSSIGVDPPTTISSVVYTADQHSIDVFFLSDLDSATHYTVVVSDIIDCPGNQIDADHNTKSFKMDEVRPTLESVVAASSTEIELLFSERVSSENINAQSLTFSHELIAENYNISGRSVIITLTTPLQNGKDYFVNIQGIEDLFGNVIQETNAPFRYFVAHPASRNDVIITEFFADPSPTIGLPETEFVEIFNGSDHPFDLNGWTITDGPTVASLPSKILLPGAYLIICQSGSLAGYEAFGDAIGVTNFPSLNNGGDRIMLIDGVGVTIDSLQYESTWYNDTEKNDGGWSIEKINPDDFCRGYENWRASIDEIGGTPGNANSVQDLTPDTEAPLFVSLSVITKDSIVLHFNERMALSVATKENFECPDLPILSVRFADDMRKDVALKFLSQMDSISQYTITVRNAADCAGNKITDESKEIVFKLDNVHPRVTEVVTENALSILVRFSEKINSSHPGKYLLDGSLIADVVQLDPSTVLLKPDTPLANGKGYLLNIADVEDLAGNTIEARDFSVMHFIASPVRNKDIVISEIFADPSPAVGLPEVEFIEIFNRSANPVQLEGWTLSDATTTARLPDHIILPEHYLILTTASRAVNFLQFGEVEGLTGFPSLSNAGEAVWLSDTSGRTIDSVSYNDDWYRDSEKKDGGYSLEIIDYNNICGEGENWTSSIDASGGTPGKVNSVIAEKPDLTPPVLSGVIPISADTIEVIFNEKLSDDLPLNSNFVFDPPIEIQNISFADRSKRSLFLQLSSSLVNQREYGLTVSFVRDCAGNKMPASVDVKFGLPEIPGPGDVLINEILFNPRPTGVDFVELINNTKKYLNLERWSTANVVNDTIRNKKEIFKEGFILAPQQIVALTTEPNTLKGEYLQGNEQAMIKSILPTLSDDEGSVALLDNDDNVIDTLFYIDDQHSPLLKDPEGVSLERIDVHAPSSNKNNWHSASGSAGYATPGLPNSAVQQNIFEEAVAVQPELFVPRTGQPDFTIISYSLDQPGYVANVKIVSADGTVIKQIASNEMLGVEGFFKWHGESDSQQKASIGAYMVWFEIFNAEGNVRTIKKRVVVADRF